MRKLKFTCTESRTAYAAAACAITEIGMTKGFKGKQMFTRAVAWQDGELRGSAAEYDAVYNALQDSVELQIRLGECRWYFSFTWPELRLISMSVATCDCVT